MTNHSKHQRNHLIVCLIGNGLKFGWNLKEGYGKTDWFKIKKGVRKSCLLSPCLFNLYIECIMRNAWLDKSQAWIKTGRRNISNLRYADDTILMAESKEELKSLLMNVKKESERAGWKLNIQKIKIMALVSSLHSK